MAAGCVPFDSTNTDYYFQPLDICPKNRCETPLQHCVALNNHLGGSDVGEAGDGDACGGTLITLRRPYLELCSLTTQSESD